ncbi:hypothetical protein [Pontibacterium sp.]|uniref:hypothetical protein n=1 Tax=Pontibacterium sp. TaxID=2036026 RepID=UPI00356AD7E7
MSWISDKYQALPERDRKMLWIFISCSLVAGYLFWAAATWAQMFETQKMANRKADRIEKRLGNVDIPKLEEGISEAHLATLKTTLDSQTRELRNLASTLLPLNDAGAREALKLELTQLAQSSMLRVSRLTTSKNTLRSNHQHLDGQALREHFSNRPHFLFSLGGHYLNLITFLDALPELSYHIYVTDIALESVPDSEGYLKIHLSLQM